MLRPKLTRAETIAANKLDRQIDAIYNRRCNGIEINIMDIGLIFKAGVAAAAAGHDVEAAVVAFVETIRKN